jgi:hypothetical protein
VRAGEIAVGCIPRSENLDLGHPAEIKPP